MTQPAGRSGTSPGAASTSDTAPGSDTAPRPDALPGHGSGSSPGSGAGGRSTAPDRTPEIRELVDAAHEGRPRAVARLLSLVEDHAATDPVVRRIAEALTSYPRHAAIVGITGAPGVGKSTLTSAMVTALRARGVRVGVLAVDPTSPFTGGALLGDRVRMQRHATDPDVFIRSMATRGRLGGLAAATPRAVRILEVAGCAVVFVETVGVGQSEVEIAGLADTTVVMLAPDSGDGIQVAKAGLLEVGDVYVVNKADRDGASRLSRELRQMLAYDRGNRDVRRWERPIVQTVATATDSEPVNPSSSAASAPSSSAAPAPSTLTSSEPRPSSSQPSAPSTPTSSAAEPQARVDVSASGSTRAEPDSNGVAKLVTALDAHRAYLEETGEIERRRLARARAELEALALAALRRRLGALPDSARVEELARAVASGTRDPYAVVDELLASLDGVRNG